MITRTLDLISKLSTKLMVNITYTILDLFVLRKKRKTVIKLTGGSKKPNKIRKFFVYVICSVVVIIIYLTLFLILRLLFPQLISHYIASLMLILLFQIISRPKAKEVILQAIIRDIEEYRETKEDSHIPTTFLKSTIMGLISIPFTTVLYCLYLIVVLLKQLSDVLVLNYPEPLSSFVLANSYSIVILIGLDRIVKSLEKEKLASSEYVRIFQESVSEKEIIEFNLNDDKYSPEKIKELIEAIYKLIGQFV